jgi:hypothetical protein
MAHLPRRAAPLGSLLDNSLPTLERILELLAITQGASPIDGHFMYIKLAHRVNSLTWDVRRRRGCVVATCLLFVGFDLVPRSNE